MIARLLACGAVGLLLLVMASLAPPPAVEGAPIEAWPVPVARVVPPLGGVLPAAMPTATHTVNVPVCGTFCDQGMDVGGGYVVVMVDAGATVFDATTGAELLRIGSFSANATSTCINFTLADDNNVLYDRAAARWVVQWGASARCMAVSQTSNPLGSWWIYTGGAGTCPNNVGGAPGTTDYPRLATWLDGYYMPINYLANDGQIGGLGVFERSQRIQGLPSRGICQELDAANTWTVPVVASITGSTLPANGSPALMVMQPASAPYDHLLLYTYAMNWTTLTLTRSGPTSLSVASYTPGTGNSASWMGSRVPYRNRGSYEQMLTVWGTLGASSQLTLDWAELRNTGSGWTVYQNGHYEPDTTARNYPAINSDSQGNIAISFAGPTLGWVGRLAGDTLGTLPQTVTLTGAAGSGAVDRSMLAIADDDCTFWAGQGHTAASFKFSGC